MIQNREAANSDQPREWNGVAARIPAAHVSCANPKVIGASALEIEWIFYAMRLITHAIGEISYVFVPISNEFGSIFLVIDSISNAIKFISYEIESN